MRKITFITFFSIVLSLYGLINYYILRTGWFVLPSGSSLRTYYLVLYLIISLSFLAGRFLERRYISWFSSMLVWIGSFWLGAMVYFFFIILFLDIIRFINYLLPFFPHFVYADYEYTKLLTAIIIIILVCITCAAGYVSSRIPVIKTISLTIPKPVQGTKHLNIAAATDIHLGTIIGKARLENIVNMMNSLEPDIILLPGDVFDEDVGPVIKQNLGETLRKLNARIGVFAVTGNHEYIGGAENACKYLEEHGISVLRDSYVTVDNTYYIAGREDRSRKGFTGNIRKPLEEILQGTDKSFPIILMDHQPVHLEDAVKNGIDLQISGHTHHGQLWPFNYITRKVYDLDRGYRKTGDTQYYVSCGAGTWGPPMRTNCRPEIVNIKLEFD
jgi:predicted MPP superfamily phosphohydrolase